MLIDCDTCTVRGQGCDDCVVTVLLGAPPGWGEPGPTVVPLTRRPRTPAGPGPRIEAGEVGASTGTDGIRAAGGRTTSPAAGTPDAPDRAVPDGDLSLVDGEERGIRPVVEFDEVERRAVRALAEFGLVPPLRHQDVSTMGESKPSRGDRHVS